MAEGPMSESPLWDAAFRERMLRQSLSNDEIAQAVEVAEELGRDFNLACDQKREWRERARLAEDERDGLRRALADNARSAQSIIADPVGPVSEAIRIRDRSLAELRLQGAEAIVVLNEGAAALAAVQSPQSEGRLSAPDYLSDADGDAAFVRRDLGATPILAAEWALGQGVNLSQMEADPVEMLPVPEHFTDIEYDWAVVRGGTPDAVAYWRFRA